MLLLYHSGTTVLTVASQLRSTACHLCQQPIPIRAREIMDVSSELVPLALNVMSRPALKTDKLGHVAKVISWAALTAAMG